MQNCIAANPFAPLQKANKLIMDDAKGKDEEVNWMSHKQMTEVKEGIWNQPLVWRWRWTPYKSKKGELCVPHGKLKVGVMSIQ